MPLTLDHRKGYFRMTDTGDQTWNRPLAAPKIQATNSCSPPRIENDFPHFQKITTGIRIGKAWSWSPSEKGDSDSWNKGEEEERAHSFARVWPCLGGKTLPQLLKMRKPRLIMSLSQPKDPQGKNSGDKARVWVFRNPPKRAVIREILICLEKVLPGSKIFGFRARVKFQKTKFKEPLWGCQLFYFAK